MGISEKTQKIVWGKAASRCSFPGCSKILVMETSDADNNSLIGQTCHIVAKSEKGPRGKSDLPVHQRDDYSNLILLCSIHHKIVDDDPKRYSIEKLHNFKKQHEAWVNEQLNLPAADNCIKKYLETFHRTPSIRNVFISQKIIPLHEIYVEVGICASDTEYEESLKYLQQETHLLLALKHRFQEKEKRKISLDYLLNEPHHPIKVVLGDPGSGKSTLMKFLAFEIAKRKFSNYEIPFLIPLREYVSLCKGDSIPFLEYVVEKELGVRDKKKQNRIIANLIALGKQKKVVFLLDGFDEVSAQGDMASWIKKAIFLLSNNFTVILTSRRAGFHGDIGTFKSFELIELSDSAIKCLVRNWFGYVSKKELSFIDQFLNWIFSQPTVINLAQNPFLLSLLCYLNQGGDENDFIQIQNRAQLYIEAVEILRRDFKDKYRREFDHSAIEKMSQFALYLFTPISGPKQLFLRDDYYHFCEKVEETKQNILDEYWLRSKIVNQWNEQETYHFIHLTFQEWSVAYRLFTLSIEDANSIITYFIYNPYWKEVFRFYAGYCALEASTSLGVNRFKALIKPIIEAQDLFGLHLFWLAPLLTEFRRGSGIQFLGFDLRIELLRLVKTIPLDDEPYLKIMVDLDPDFFLEQSYIAINAHLKENQLPVLSIPALAHTNIYYKKNQDSLGNLQFAIKILRYIFHPNAVKILYHLMELDIQEDMDDTILQTIQTPLSMSLYAHSTEILRTKVRQKFLQTNDVIKKLNILFFLKGLMDQENADAIYNEACCIDDLDFQVQSLNALAGMQDVRALELAKQLWENEEFRKRDEYFDDIIQAIEELQSPLSTGLLEDWLSRTEDIRKIYRITLAIIQNDFGSDYSLFVPYLDYKDEDVRINALTIILRRGKERAIGYFTESLFDPEVSSQFKQDLLFHIAEQKLPQFEEILTNFLGQLRYSDDPELWISAWSSYTMLHSKAEMPHEGIIKNAVLPRFFDALDRYLPKETGLIDQWLDAFMDSSAEVKRAVWTKMKEVYPCLTEESKMELLMIMESNPESYFFDWVSKEALSKNSDIHQLATGILVKIDTGKAIKLKDEYPHIRKELFRRSVEKDILFYEDYYIDQAGNTISYDFSGEITVRVSQ